MDGLYQFWYCTHHDDGAIVYYSKNEINKLRENAPNGEIDYENIGRPEWLNICYDNEADRHLHCNYAFKGIISLNEGTIEELSPVQTSYEREGGGFKFKYYIDNIFRNNHKIVNLSEPLVDWFNTKLHEPINR